MSDLSQLLGDLYADETPSPQAPAPAPAASPAPEAATQVWSMDDDASLEATQAPAWSSDDALDQAFATWVPGPTDDAPSAERSIVAGVMSTPPAPAPAPAPELESWRETAPPMPARAPLPAAPRLAAPAPAPARPPAYDDDDWRRDPAPALASPTIHARWAPSDDDILPVRRGRKRR